MIGPLKCNGFFEVGQRLERVGLSGLPARDVASCGALGTAARAGLVEFAPISDALPAI